MITLNAVTRLGVDGGMVACIQETGEIVLSKKGRGEGMRAYGCFDRERDDFTLSYLASHVNACVPIPQMFDVVVTAAHTLIQ